MQDLYGWVNFAKLLNIDKEYFNFELKSLKESLNILEKSLDTSKKDLEKSSQNTENQFEDEDLYILSLQEQARILYLKRKALILRSVKSCIYAIMKCENLDGIKDVCHQIIILIKTENKILMSRKERYFVEKLRREADKVINFQSDFENICEYNTKRRKL